MADYIEILDAQVDPDAPLTSSLGGQFRDNWIAGFEASDGAPVNEWAWHPYNMTAVGDGNDGEIWSDASDGATSTITSPIFVSGFEYRLFIDTLRATGGGGVSGEFDISFYKSSDASYTVVGNIITSSTSDMHANGIIEIYHPSVTNRMTTGNASIYTVGSSSSDSFSLALGLFDSTFQAITRVRLSVPSSGQNFDSGSVYMYKRKDPFFLP